MSAIMSSRWHHLFKKIRSTIENDPVPYVTRLSRQHEKKSNLPFIILVSTIISLRTKDAVTEAASERLFKAADTPFKMTVLSTDKIAKLIYPAGFYRVKAKQIFECSKIILEKYNGKTPNQIDQLTEMPGVGRKTANLVLTEGYDLDGICVDVHVHRILNRLGIINTMTPDETEIRLRENLPKKFWKKINFWLVTFGQYHCKPVKPECSKCLLKKECPSAKSQS